MPINEALRKRLAEPFGEVLEFKEVIGRLRSARPSTLIGVGDQTIIHLLDAGLMPDIGIFDLLCQRKEVPAEWKEKLADAARREGGAMRTYNPPGTVQARMEARVRDVLGIGYGWIEIDGEDDLCSLVVMAFAREGSVLLYGQPNKGMVWVEIDAKRQKEAQEMLGEIKRMR